MAEAGAQMHERTPVDVRRVRVSRGGAAVLLDVSLEMKRGEVHALLGPNGCGKSTLLAAIRKQIAVESGSIDVNVPASHIAYVPQNPDHHVVMPTAGADVAFNRSARGESDVADIVEEALDRVRLGGLAGAPTGTLSGGQRQRVAVAGTLVADAEVLLLDELTSYLDPDDADAVLDAVRACCRGPRAAAALWVTHRLQELDKCDRATYIEDGKVLLHGSGTYVRERILRWQSAL